MARRAGSDTLYVAGFMQGLKFSRYHLQILVLYSLVTYFDGQDFSALPYALPYIRDDMGISDEMTGYVSSAAFLGQMIGSLFGSYLGDVFGRRPDIIACTMGSAVLGGPAFVPFLLIGAVMVGAGHAVVISITSICYPSTVRSAGGGWASFMAKFAAVAAPIAGAGMGFLQGVRGAIDGYLFTVLCLAGIVVFLLLLAIVAKSLAEDPRNIGKSRTPAAEPAEWQPALPQRSLAGRSRTLLPGF